MVYVFIFPCGLVFTFVCNWFGLLFANYTMLFVALKRKKQLFATKNLNSKMVPMLLHIWPWPIIRLLVLGGFEKSLKLYLKFRFSFCELFKIIFLIMYFSFQKFCTLQFSYFDKLVTMHNLYLKHLINFGYLLFTLHKFMNFATCFPFTCYMI